MRNYSGTSELCWCLYVAGFTRKVGPRQIPALIETKTIPHQPCSDVHDGRILVKLLIYPSRQGYSLSANSIRKFMMSENFVSNSANLSSLSKSITMICARNKASFWFGIGACTFPVRCENMLTKWLTNQGGLGSNASSILSHQWMTLLDLKTTLILGRWRGSTDDWPTVKKAPFVSHLHQKLGCLRS